MNRRRCRACGHGIRFAVTEVSGQAIALDARPSKLNGAILVQQGKARLLSPLETGRARGAGYDLYTAHNAWCPGAEIHARMHAHAPLVEIRKPPPRQLSLELEGVGAG